MLYCILSGQEDSGGVRGSRGSMERITSWLFSSGGAWTSLEAVSRRLRSRDWLVLIHDGSRVVPDLREFCVSALSTRRSRPGAPRPAAGRVEAAAPDGRTRRQLHGGGTVEREPESAGARSNLHRRQSLTIRADFTCISTDLSSPHLLMRTGHVPPWNNPCLEIGRPCNRSSSSTPHKAVPHLRMDPS